MPVTRTRYLILLLTFVLSASVMSQAPAALSGFWLFVYVLALAGVAVHLLLLTVCTAVWRAIGEQDRTQLLSAINLYRPAAVLLSIVAAALAGIVVAAP